MIIVHPGTEAIITAALQDSNHDGRTVIFLVTNPTQSEEIKTALPHFYAISEKGKYRYFSTGSLYAKVKSIANNNT